MLDWTGMRDFLAVAEEGSLSAAAKRLEVSQPTVGRRIAQLEERLGAPLFIRTPKGLDLTDTGELILDHTRRMEEEAHAVERLVTGQEASLSGTVRVSTVEAIGVEWLVQNMLPFRALYPDITLEIHIDSNTVDLLRGEADIAIRLMRPGQADLISKKVATMASGMYASQDYLARKGAPASVDDLPDHDFVLPTLKLIEDVQSLVRIPIDQKHNTVFRSNSFIALLNATRFGYGIGVHTPLYAQYCPELVRLLPEITVIEMDVFMVMHPDLRRSARIRAVWDFISTLFQQNREMLMGKAEPDRLAS
jgi:DNA-binding transcriptional LysR family regulator